MQGRTLYVYNRMAMGMRDNRARFIYDFSIGSHFLLPHINLPISKDYLFIVIEPIVFQIVNLNMNFINCENPIGPTAGI